MYIFDHFSDMAEHGVCSDFVRRIKDEERRGGKVPHHDTLLTKLYELRLGQLEALSTATEDWYTHVDFDRLAKKTGHFSYIFGCIDSVCSESADANPANFTASKCHSSARSC